MPSIGPEPILSFLLLRARCRACAGAIAWRYPAVELLTGLLFLGVVWRFGVGGRAALWAAFLAAPVVVAFIDLEHLIVPDRISLPGVGLGLASALIWPPPGFWSALVGVLVGAGFFLAAAWASAFLLNAGRIEVDAEQLTQQLQALRPSGRLRVSGADLTLARIYQNQRMLADAERHFRRAADGGPAGPRVDQRLSALARPGRAGEPAIPPPMWSRRRSPGRRFWSLSGLSMCKEAERSHKQFLQFDSNPSLVRI